MSGALEALRRALGPWQKPPDVASQAALVIAVVLLVSAFARGGPSALGLFDAHALRPASRRRFLTVAGFAAAFLSLGYIAVYLRGGPRIVDATSYFLQGRALSHGKLAWLASIAGEPSASFRGRFLLTHDGALAGIFPPGYPLLLAAGFLVGAPMVVGPVLAAGLVVATYALAREVAADVLGAGEAEDARVEGIARLAALLSIASAALRYHTADTMSHGASALGVTVALASALHARRIDRGALAPWILCGLSVGYVAATRLASAVPIGAVVLLVAMRTRTPRAATTAIFFAMLPGLALLAAAQRAATGDLFASTQRAYYAQSDGPPGCFRYGFGAGIGCLYEHADYVRGNLAGGFDLLAAAKTTGRRLHMHLGDVANLAPLALLCLAPLRRTIRARDAAGPCFALLLGFVVVYAPFYFDGSYPGGGARFFADVLPVEHALLALAVFQLAPSMPFARKAAGLLAVALGAFALHAVAWHRQLAERDGGRPMYEPDVTRRAHVERGLVFLETDHGFNLAHDPAATASHGIVAARLRGDDHDRVLYDALGKPPAFLYKLPVARPDAASGDLGAPALVPWSPPLTASSLAGYSFEAEAEWPPLAQSAGWVEPRWASGTCASGGRALALMVPATGASPAGPSAPAEAWIELPVAESGPVDVVPYPLALGGPGAGSLELHARLHGSEPLAQWAWRDDAKSACEALGAVRVTLTAPRAYLRFRGEMPPGAPRPASGQDPSATAAAYLDHVDVVKAPR